MQRDPYRFFGDWTEDEQQAVLDTLFAHIPRKVPVIFDVWNFHKFNSTSFHADQDHRDTGIMAGSAEEMADGLDAFYRL